jgi:hypothetical protein
MAAQGRCGLWVAARLEQIEDLDMLLALLAVARASILER